MPGRKSYGSAPTGRDFTSTHATFRSITFNDLPYNLSKPVRALYIDHERSLWVGTKGEGLLRIPNFYHRKTFDASHVEQITTANSELLDNSVYTFAASRSAPTATG